MNDRQDKRIPDIIFPALLLIIPTLVYANSFQGEFTLDDFINILNNRGITLFTFSGSGIMEAATDGPSQFRWLPNLSFAINYLLHGENVWGYHLGNLIIHLAGTIVLYFLGLTTLSMPIFSDQYPKKREIAFVAALLWAVHPLQTNGVTYIVQRMTSMATLFYLSALLSYARGRLARQFSTRQHLLYGLCLLFGLMAITSKEISYMLPAMIFAYEFFFCRKTPWTRSYKALCLWMVGAAALIFLCVTLIMGGDIFSHVLDGYRYRDFTLPQRLLTESRVFFLYLSLLILPLPSRLNLNHEFSLSYSLVDPVQTLIACLGIGVFIGLTFFLFNRNRLLSFGLLWFMANLIMESTIIPLELVFEHRLYLPSTFLVLGLTATLYNLTRRYPLFLRTGFLLLVSLFSIWTWQRNQVWTSNVSLWSDVVAKSPGLGRGYNNLGVALHEQGDTRQAEEIFIRAIEVDPESRLGYQSLGSLYISQNRLEEADRILKTGLTKETFLSPARIYHYLGVIERKSGRYPQALQYAKKALDLNSNDLDPLMTIGIVYGKMGEPLKAFAAFQQAEDQGMKSVDLYNNWGIIAFQLGQTDRSLHFFNKALEIDPDHPESHNNLGLAFSKLGRMEEARKEMETAMRLKQQNKP